MNKVFQSLRETLVLGLVSGLLFVSGDCRADDIFKWVDEKGDTHFADRIEKVPPQYRSQVEHREVKPGPAPVPGSPDDDPAPATSPDSYRSGPAAEHQRAKDRRAGRCNRDPDRQNAACYKACLDPKNRQAANDCQKYRQAQAEKARQAREKRKQEKRQAAYQRCLRHAHDQAAIARCVQRTLPPPSDKPTVIQP